MTPRLLTEKQAREYLGDVDPRMVMQPIRLGCRVRWDRLALDDHLNSISKRQTDKPKSPLEAWEAGRDEDAA